MAVIRKDFVKRIVAKGVPEEKAEKIVELFFTTIKEALIKGERVHLVNFGEFRTRVRKEREGVNPQTQERMVIKSKRVPIFKPAAAFKTALLEDEKASSG
jgi:nucleoid DNA-binding protein